MSVVIDFWERGAVSVAAYAPEDLVGAEYAKTVMRIIAGYFAHLVYNFGPGSDTSKLLHYAEWAGTTMLESLSGAVVDEVYGDGMQVASASVIPEQIQLVDSQNRQPICRYSLELIKRPDGMFATLIECTAGDEGYYAPMSFAALVHDAVHRPLPWVYCAGIGTTLQEMSALYRALPGAADSLEMLLAIPNAIAERTITDLRFL